MKNSDILIEAKADIADPAHWNQGCWVAGYVGAIMSADDLLRAPKVCAITSVARVCLRHQLVELDFTYLANGPHICDCPHCETEYVEQVEARDIDAVLGDFDHEAKEILDEAAEELYDQDMMMVNDDKKYTHADVMAVYDLAIAKAKLLESEEAVS